MRKSNASGNLHKEGINSLTKQIEDAFEHEKGPGSLPPKKNPHLKGIMVPHDAYDLVAPAMAWSYFSMGKPDVYVIFGVNPSNNQTVLTQEPTETPFGTVRVDQNLARELLEKGNVQESLKDFEKDKKIDSQLPFIQYLNKDRLEKIKILPILLANDAEIAELSADIKEVLSEQNKTATFICVANLTYYGTQYKYAPYVNEIKKNLYESDAKIIEFIKNNDPEGMDNFVDANLITLRAMTAIKFLLKLLYPKKAHLQQYYTSGDINHVDNPSITYSAMIFE